MRRCVFLAASSLLATLACAQSFSPVREQKNLSPGALAKLHTLEELNALPAGEWRFHAGDLPHGEAPTLDDSAWPLMVPRTKAPKEAVWYRREITIPRTVAGYDISGSTISFQFRADANGSVPEIIYFNGRRVALGEDLEPIVLAQPAHPGDKILVAVKLLQTVDVKSFSGVALHIDPPTDTGRPDANSVRVQCIAAANLLPALPAPRRDLLPRVEAAVSAIDIAALGAANQAAFDASLRKSQAILNELHTVLAGADLTLDGNAHIDAAWLWPRTETVDVVKRTFSTALQLMNEYPNYVFTQSAAQYSEWMADKYPDLNAQIKQRVKEGRWEIVGGMWVEPDLNLPDGESLVRQLLVGQRFFGKEYGVTARIGWNPDSFGYNWQLPQIYKRSGLDYFVTQKMHWNDTNQLPFRLFWWESPDGSKVLTYFPTDYVHDNLSPTRLTADFAESAERNPGTTHMLDLYGIGDHGGGPTRAMLDEGDGWIAANKSGEALPTLHYGTAQSYFDAVQPRLNPVSPTWNYDKLATGWTAPAAGENGTMGLPTWNDELYFEYHRGVYSTQAKHKANIRRSEVATLDIEKLASFAWLHGAAYPSEELNENWKKITFNQFHDLAAGSGIAVIYRDAQDDFSQVFRNDVSMTGDAQKAVANEIDTQKQPGVPILVMNALAWPRKELVKIDVRTPEAGDLTLTDDTGHKVPSQLITYDTRGLSEVFAQVEVPALGYTVLHASASQIRMPVGFETRPEDLMLANSKLVAFIDPKTGCITQITDPSLTRKFLAPNLCGNQLQTFSDTPKNYDAWNIDPGTLDGTMTPISNVDSVTEVAAGPLRKTVRIQRTWSKSHFIQDISLDADSDIIRIDTTVDWHETHVLLKAAFPLAASSPKATFAIPSGSIARPTPRNNSFEKAKFEVPALRWADLGDEHQGVSILNDSKYGYDALGNTLRLTLLRSPTWPDPDADRGIQHFSYAIYPHAGTWRQADTVRRGYEFNDPLTATQVFAHNGTLPPTHSFAALDEKNVVLTAVKKAEDADALIFRMYESTGSATTVHLHVPAGATYAVETNLMEIPEATHLPMTGDVVSVGIRPYEILTLSVFYPHAPPTRSAAAIAAVHAGAR